MDEKIKSALQKIKLLADKNPEFAQELRKMFECTSSADVVPVQESITKDIVCIREALEIRADKTIIYDFVKNINFRNQLIIDNLRMENAALDLQKEEKERFYDFCVNAFYQLENIINYYYHITYPNINSLLAVIETYTSQEAPDYQFKRSGKEVNVSSIAMCDKANSLCNMFFPGDNIKATIGTLRKVRNEGEHRWSSIIDNNDANNQLYKFYRFQTFNSIRSLLKRVVNVISENLGKPVPLQPNIIKATITSLLASACFVRYGDNQVSLPYTLLPKVKECTNGQEINLVFSGPKIIDVIILSKI